MGSTLGQLHFGTAICLMEELFRIKVSAEELLSRSSCFHTALTFSDELLFGKG